MLCPPEVSEVVDRSLRSRSRIAIDEIAHITSPTLRDVKDLVNTCFLLFVNEKEMLDPHTS